MLINFYTKPHAHTCMMPWCKRWRGLCWSKASGAKCTSTLASAGRTSVALPPQPRKKKQKQKTHIVVFTREVGSVQEVLDVTIYAPTRHRKLIPRTIDLRAKHNEFRECEPSIQENEATFFSSLRSRPMGVQGLRLCPSLIMGGPSQARRLSGLDSIKPLEEFTDSPLIRVVVLALSGVRRSRELMLHPK